MNRNLLTVVLIGLVVLSVLLGPYMKSFMTMEPFTSDVAYSAYFTPWWRTYFPGPYYGTSATAFNKLVDWPYSSEYWRKPSDYYNYWSYWRRPLYMNYWRRPYYYSRPVYRPYLRDSIPARRYRKRMFNFVPYEQKECLEKMQRDGSYLYGTFRDYR